MKREQELTIEFLPVAKEAVEKKGWFWRKLGEYFLKTVMPAIFAALLKKYHIVPIIDNVDGD